MLPKCGEVKKIQSMTTNRVFNTTDETVLMNLEFESGATAQIFNSILLHIPFKIEVYGQNNSIIGSRLTSSNDKGELLLNGSPMEYTSPINLYVCELNNFVNAINKNNSVEVPISEGLRNIELLLQS
jgi:hypothetical protein